MAEKRNEELIAESAAVINHPEITAAALTEQEEIYKENIIDHYKYPRNKKELSQYTCSRTESNPLCGDKISIYLAVDAGKITEISFQGHGCAISQASASMLTEHSKGMSLSSVASFTEKDVQSLLGIPLSPIRMKCAILSLKTIHKALEELK
ncbi:MAG: SUF system NifU family Fe-S cluster assembly protein [Nanoarchaeota archaeon]|nr:SUF system NifU family Fe-S cluster assembly protein [Nanoarchaeota archaeon]